MQKRCTEILSRALSIRILFTTRCTSCKYSWGRKRQIQAAYANHALSSLCRAWAKFGHVFDETFRTFLVSSLSVALHSVFPRNKPCSQKIVGNTSDSLIEVTMQPSIKRLEDFDLCWKLLSRDVQRNVQLSYTNL